MILYLKHIAIEGPGTIIDFFKEKGFPSKIIELGQGENIPSDLTDVEAVIILGGPMNVYEEEKCPFLKIEDVFIKRVMEERIPLLGICLGSQLMAKAANAHISKSPTKEIGCSTVFLTEEGQKDLFFNGLNMLFDVFQWHEDTFAIPEGADWLVSNNACPHQAFRLGNYAYGLQFHIEVTEEIIESWIKKYFKADNAYIHPQGAEILSQFKEKKEEINNTAQLIYNNFLNVIQMKNKFVQR